MTNNTKASISKELTVLEIGRVDTKTAEYCAVAEKVESPFGYIASSIRAYNSYVLL